MTLRTRIWVLITAIFCIALVLLGIIFGLLPQLAIAASTNGIAQTTEATTDAQRTNLEVLKSSETRVGQMSEELERLRAAIPDTAASAELIALFDRLEERTGAVLSRFTLAAPVAGGAADTAPTDSSAQQPASGDAPSADVSTTTESTADASGDSSHTGPPTAPGTTMLPVEFELTGDFDQTMDFVRGLQTGERLVVVTVVVQTDSGTTLVSGAVYVWGEEGGIE